MNSMPGQEAEILHKAVPPTKGSPKRIEETGYLLSREGKGRKKVFLNLPEREKLHLRG
jgi:hypothetical protein